MIGAQFGGYRIESPLAAGGMGGVFRATDVQLNRTVALKLLAPKLAAETLANLLYSRPPLPPLELAGSDSGEIARITGKCLAKEPAERHQHADELALDLKAAARRTSLLSGEITAVGGISTPAAPSRSPCCAVSRWAAAWAVFPDGKSLLMNIRDIAAYQVLPDGME
jgi:serine/threonine protein kinase